MAPSAFSSRTTPREAAWWEHCRWLSPSPSLFLSLFLSCWLSLIFPLVSHVPSSPPFPPRPCLSPLRASLRALLWRGPPTEEQGGIFSIHISASAPRFYSTAFLLQLSFSTSVLLFSPTSIHQPHHHHHHPHLPMFPPCSHMPLSLLILMACLVRSKAAKRPPRRHHIRRTHRGPKHGEKMALPCCVSHLEKSHTNSARQKNPNQT